MGWNGVADPPAAPVATGIRFPDTSRKASTRHVCKRPIIHENHLWYGHQQNPESGLERESAININGFPPLSTSEYEIFFTSPVG